MNILCDYHHGELYESILKLFEDRMGHNVYRSIGTEWATNGYWNIGVNPDVIEQYLGSTFSTETSDHGIWVEDGNGYNDYYNNVLNVFERSPHKKVTLDKAKNMKWDIIITSMLGHWNPMESFRKSYCPTAKHIFQIGNMLFPEQIPSDVKNVMNSTSSDCSKIPNVVNYNQEFNVKWLEWVPPINEGKAVYCFLMNNPSHMGDAFMDLEKTMQEWVFKEYGALCRDGSIHKNQLQCQKMCESGFMWHVKRNGDGYGYNLYRALYAGRPVIINMDVYKTHRLAEFLIDGENCIDYSKRSVKQIREELIRMQGNWEYYSQKLCRQMRDLVDFNREEQKVRVFLENIL